MEPILRLKPSIVNAITPILLKYAFRSLLINAFIYLLYSVLNQYHLLSFSPKGIILSFGIAFTLIALIPILIKTIALYNTEYLFYRTHVLSNFQFMKIQSLSVPYHQIVNIQTKISFWDRLCKAGNITLYTAEDNAPELTLYYLAKPREVEQGIYKLIHMSGGESDPSGNPPTPIQHKNRTEIKKTY